MLDLSTITDIEIAAREGQLELAELVRGLVRRNAPEVYEALDSATSAPWLEPSLFAWFTYPVSQLDLRQILYRWLSLPFRPQALRVPVSAYGVVLVPGEIVFENLPPNTVVEVVPPSNRDFSEPGQKFTSAEGITKKVFITSCGLEVCPKVDMQVQTCLRQGGAVEIFPVSGAEADDFCNNLELALRQLRETSRELHRLLGIANRRVYFYKATGLNSFASIAFHGATFLNVPKHATKTYFLDDYAHQGGHVVFNAATMNKEEYLAISPETPLREVGGPASDPRKVYAAFHGLFTYSTIVTALGNKYCVSTNDDVHELRGRLAFTLLKFRVDLENLGDPGIFTLQGRRFYASFRDCYARTVERFRSELHGLNLSNQPYSFDYGLFLELNATKKIAKKEGA